MARTAKARERPANYPKLTDYQPTRFMLPESHYDAAKADRAVRFIDNLCHTKGRWAGKPFWLLPWQEQIIRDIFGVVKEDDTRQFRTAYVEIPKKNGKSELAAAIALYLLYADNEPSAEVYGEAADRQQASIVFDVAKRMVEMTPVLLKRSKIMAATKRLVNYSNVGFYQVLSAEVGTKHGLNVSGLVRFVIHVCAPFGMPPLRRRAARFSVGEVLKVVGDRFCNLGVVCCGGVVVVPFAFSAVCPCVNRVFACPVVAEADDDLVDLALVAVHDRDSDRRVVFCNPKRCEGCLHRRGLRQAGNAGSADQLGVLQQADLCGHFLQFGFKKVHGVFLRFVYSVRFPVPLYT